jgi:PAS domain S-box-containing protein
MNGNIFIEEKEFRALHKSGGEFFVEMSLGEYKEGLKSQFTSVMRDVTERKKIEEFLVKNKKEMDDFFENASVALHWISPDGVIQRANKAELNLLGYEREEYVGQHISRFFADQSAVDQIILKFAKKENLNNFQARLRHKNGSIRSVLIDTNISEDGGRYIRCFTRDITEQLKAEETKTLLASLVESSDDAIIGKTMDGNIISWNYGAEKIYGYKEDEILGKNVSFLMPPDRKDEYQNLLARLINGEKILQHESMRTCKDGRLIHISLTFSPIWNSNGKLIGVSGIEQDITAKKNIAMKLENSLKEKEVLLKEIHHRVKNNLQIVSSLLNLQSAYIENKKDLGLFRESQNRIRVMALIHEKLYRSKEFHQIDMEGYLKDLVVNLLRTYNITKGKVNIDLNIEKFYLSVDKIVTLGLILNELVTNSINHAFRNKEKGKIFISLHEKNGNIFLTEGDTGNGLPSDFDFKNTESLGLKLVLTLVDQLEGTIEYRNEETMEFRIVFPNNTPNH